MEGEVSTLKTQEHDAVKLQGVEVDSTAPAEGQVLRYTGTTWSATDDAGADLTSVQEDIVSNSNSITSLQTAVNTLVQQEHDAVKLDGVVVQAPAPIIGQLLRYNGEKWVAGNDAVTFENFDSLKTDVDALKAQEHDAVKLQGVAVDATRPTMVGQLLTYSGSNWIAASPEAHDAVKLQGVAVDGTAPTEGQVLKYEGGKWVAGIEAGADAQSAVESLRSTVLYQTTVPATDDGRGSISLPADGSGAMLVKILSADSSTIVRIDDGNIIDKVTLVFDVAGVSLLSSGTFVNSMITNTPFVSAVGSSITFVLKENPHRYWEEQSRQDLFPAYFLLDTAGHDAVKLQGIPVDGTAPTEGQVLKYEGGKWISSTVSGTGGEGVDMDTFLALYDQVGVLMNTVNTSEGRISSLEHEQANNVSNLISDLQQEVEQLKAEIESLKAA